MTGTASSKRSLLGSHFQHLRRKSRPFRYMFDRVTLPYQVTSLVKGPATAGVNPANDDLTCLATLFRPAQTRTTCQRSTSDISLTSVTTARIGHIGMTAPDEVHDSGPRCPNAIAGWNKEVASVSTIRRGSRLSGMKRVSCAVSGVRVTNRSAVVRSGERSMAPSQYEPPGPMDARPGSSHSSAGPRNPGWAPRTRPR